MGVTTAWVDPPTRIKGQDPLAVRAPCENIYTQLLPGITNVTDRASLYAFYPWVIWALERHAGPLSKKPFFNTLRRAECLVTLIGAWHTNETEEGLWLHGGGLVGRDKLIPALKDLEDGKSLKLSTFATLDEDSGHRYFKNKLGGLGQYYLGTLRDLGIVEGDAREIKYVTERGGALAETFDTEVDRKLFFETLEQDRITLESLRQLRRFCPCYLNSNNGELTALVDLFFNRPGIFNEQFSDSRRDTLALMLDLALKLKTVEHETAQNGFDADVFRASAYAEALPGAAAWTPPVSLQRVRDGWQTYQRNELLSIAIQSVFWTGLAELLNQGGQLLQSSEDYQAWFTATFDSSRLKLDLSEPFEVAVDRTRRSIPPLGAWTDESHEIQLGWRLGDIQNSFNRESLHADVLCASLNLILNLAARQNVNNSAYTAFIQSRNYLLYYPINLDSFYRNVEDSWRTLTLQDLLGRLSNEWGVSAHFRVALRKLRYETRDTFKIKPTERGLEVIDAPPPVFSNPRLGQAIQILRDLGALELRSDRWEITDQGKLLLEECSRD